jgi:hypothetical protein
MKAGKIKTINREANQTQSHVLELGHYQVVHENDTG